MLKYITFFLFQSVSFSALLIQKKSKIICRMPFKWLIQAMQLPSQLKAPFLFLLPNVVLLLCWSLWSNVPCTPHYIRIIVSKSCRNRKIIRFFIAKDQQKNLKTRLFYMNERNKSFFQNQHFLFSKVQKYHFGKFTML